MQLHQPFLLIKPNIESGKVMNAFAHMTLGLVSSNSGQDFGVIDYADQDGGSHMASKFPYIILRVDNLNQIRTLRNVRI